MQGLVKKSKDHLNHNNMTYSQHFNFAFGNGLVCIKAGLFLCIHSIFPCFFQKTGSRLVHRLEKIFVEREFEINESKSNIQK